MRMALQSGQTSTSDRKGGAGFVQSRDTGSRYIPPFEVTYSSLYISELTVVFPLENSEGPNFKFRQTPILIHD